MSNCYIRKPVCFICILLGLLIHSVPSISAQDQVILEYYSITATSSGDGSGVVGSMPGGISYDYPTNTTGTTTEILHGTSVILSATANTDVAVIWKNCREEGGEASGNITTTTDCSFSSLEGNVALVAEFVRAEDDVCAKYECGSKDYYYTTEECVTEFENYFNQTGGEMPPCIPTYSDDIFYKNELFCYVNWRVARKEECDQYFNCRTDQYSVIDEVESTQYDVCLMNKRAQGDVCLLGVALLEYSHCTTELLAPCRDEYNITGDSEVYQACVESVQPQIDDCEMIDNGDFYITMEMLDLIDSTLEENNICPDNNIWLYLPIMLMNSRNSTQRNIDK